MLRPNLSRLAEKKIYPERVCNFHYYGIAPHQEHKRPGFVAPTKVVPRFILTGFIAVAVSSVTIPASADSPEKFDEIRISTDLTADLIETEDEINNDIEVIVSASPQLANVDQQPEPQEQPSPEPAVEATVAAPAVPDTPVVSSSDTATESEIVTEDTEAILSTSQQLANVDQPPEPQEQPSSEPVVEATVAAPAAPAETVPDAPVVSSSDTAAEPEIVTKDTTQPVPAETSPDTFYVEIERIIQGWAHAWASQDIDRYLGFYAGEFLPDDASLSREQWTELRYSRVLNPSRISLTLADIEITESEETIKEAVFQQSYKSNIYSDVIIKSMKFVEQDGEWKILAERTVRVMR